MIPERVDPRLSPMQIIHASAFSGGLVALMAAVLTSNPVWYLVAGPLLALSGGLILIGYRITLRGTYGEILRGALGAGGMRRVTVRGVAWLVIGVLVSVWGITALHARDAAEPQLEEPLVWRGSCSDSWHATRYI